MIFNFPSPALPGSGAMGMISARNIRAPPLDLNANVNILHLTWLFIAGLFAYN